MRKVKIAIAGLFLISVLLCAACSANGNAVLQVESYDYEGLHTMRAGELDEETESRWPFFTENPYYGYVCHVSERNGSLFVSSHWGSSETYSISGANGYFLGVDRGEFDGWIRYFPDYSILAPEIVGEPKLVVGENCRGLIRIDSYNGYALTGLAHVVADTGAVYKLLIPQGEKEWTWVKLGELSGMPRVYSYHEESHTIYIATTQELLALSTIDDSITVLADLSPWRHSGAVSVLEFDGKVYVGMCMGIYEYDLSNGKSLWYPMDFKKYVG